MAILCVFNWELSQISIIPDQFVRHITGNHNSLYYGDHVRKYIGDLDQIWQTC